MGGADGSETSGIIFRFFVGLKFANTLGRKPAPDGKTSIDKARRARGKTRPYSTVGLGANEMIKAVRKDGGMTRNIKLRSEDFDAAASNQSTVGRRAFDGSGPDAVKRAEIFAGGMRPGIGSNCPVLLQLVLGYKINIFLYQTKLKDHGLYNNFTLLKSYCK